MSSSQTLNAALQGFADAGRDGIIQVSTGGAEYLSGPTVKNMVTGSVAFAAYAAEVAKNYPVNVALHTDHCPKDKLDGFVRPLIDDLRRAGRARRARRCSSRTCGTAPPYRSTRTSQIAEELLAKACRRRTSSSRSRSAWSAARRTASSARSTRSSTRPPRTRWPPSTALGIGENGRYMTALTFGNVHGVYKPGNVKLRPEILKDAQEAVVEKLGLAAGSQARSTWSSTAAPARCPRRSADAVDYGVVKMNVDTDTQYAFTRPVADHMFRNYDGVLKVDGEVGNKKVYDPRAWGKAGEEGMAARVVEACENLRSTGHALGA